MHTTLYSIFAGIAMAIAGIAYLSPEDPIIGSLLFSSGLIITYSFDWYLFTGKACYVAYHPPKYLKFVSHVLVINILTASAFGYLMRNTKLIHTLVPKAVILVESKLSNSLLSGFLLAFGCGILMYVAVIGHRRADDDFGKYILLIIPVVIYSTAGFEHVIADSFYFSFANAWTVDSFIYLCIVALGNLTGCSLIPYCEKLDIHRNEFHEFQEFDDIAFEEDSVTDFSKNISEDVT
ncbi:MAG: formate/nitrite transporter family protein [Clostridia bacterium]